MTLFIPALLAALSSSTVFGVVRADSTREPISHALVEVVEADRRVAVDARGYFVVAGLPAGTWTVRASALGYRTHEVEVRVGGSASARVDFDLALEPVRLSDLEVRAEAEPLAGAARAGPPPLRVEGAALTILSGLAEADVLRAIQTLPSVAAASDFSSAPYVRGGTPDQNLVLLDGTPLFNPYHMGGVFGAFDPATISSVEVLPGAFPASIGDRLSSAISIATRDGGRDHVRGHGSIGLISSSAGLDGPLPSGRGSYLFSVRRTYVDLFTDAAYALDLIDFTLPYAFTDGHLKLTHDVGALGTLTAAAYVNQEGIEFPKRMEEAESMGLDFGWGSRAASLSFRRPFGARLLGEFRAAYSDFHGTFEGWDEYRGWTADADGSTSPGLVERQTVVNGRTRMRDLLAAADFTWYAPGHEVGFGVQADFYRLAHDISDVVGELDVIFPPMDREDRPRTVAAYVEDEWIPSDAFRLRAGLRVLGTGAGKVAWLPRVGARWAFAPRLALSLGGGRSAQVLHTLRNEESLWASIIAYDFLGAVPAARGPLTAEDVVLGLEWSGASTRARLDAYAKRMDLLVPPIPADPMDAPIFVADGLRPAEGRSHGVEALVQHRRGRLELSLAYALLFAEIEAGGERYAPRFERRHALDASAALPLGERGHFSVRLALATGQPFTPVVGIVPTLVYDPDHGFYPLGQTMLVDEHNSERLPGYLRLDLAARKSFDKRWFGTDLTLTPYLQVVNVLNSKNVLFADPSPYGWETGGPQYTYAPQLPVLPTFGVEWRF